MNPDLRHFLSRLRHRLATAAAPDPLPADTESVVRQTPPGADIVETFRAAATIAGVVVTLCDETAWPHHAFSALAPRDAATPRTAATPRDAATLLIRDTLPERLRRRLPELERLLASEHIAIARPGDDAELFAAGATITGVAAAIAETGSLIWHAGPGAPRAATLVPPLHVAVVAVEQIVPDLHDYLASLSPVVPAPLSARTPLPSHLNIITGPSKTADIEGVLVTGVHGPGRVRAILVRT
ncbi:MAG: lactate utilization protein [Phycisphaerae bacterium]|nr:lactate utilization protein [Phycisphaerae bacterium]MCZ2399844.1 lactate utilization protein [Phycisphaerae bacterium]